MSRAKTEMLGASLTEIPVDIFWRIGEIFKEGHEKYGRHNWATNPDREFVLERLNHAILHMLFYAYRIEYGVEHPMKNDAQRGEDDLAKAAWGLCVLSHLEFTHPALFLPADLTHRTVV